ncbi:MAG: DNA recombination protein RmuC [Gammaproteobacteria bacterium]|nr:DNA recombination protein RmuC [Gammaproteobacteria bacterium]
MELTATHVLLLLASGAALGAAVVLLRGMGREAGAVEAMRARLEAEARSEAALQEERLEHARAELATLAAERDRLREELRALGEQAAGLRESKARLEERAEAQQRHDRERFAELENARKRMTEEFQNLANRILEEKGKAFSERSQNSLDALLRPVREQLDGFRRKVEEVHLSDTRERASLREQLEMLKQLNQQMNDEARNLTRALKGDKKSQGNWGELVLERVLEQCGLRVGQEYEVQGSYRDEDNRLLRPDVVVHLPEEKEIVIDSKVSLVAWTRYVAAEDDAARESALRDHVLAVRNHIRSLSEKDYAHLKGVRSLDFVLMFMPIEAAFMAAFQHDEKLFGEAFEKRIAVVTPTTLLATMRTVESLWRNERQNDNARRIADQAGRIYDKLRGFLEDFERIGTQLATVQNSYDGARNKLTDGRGNLLKQVESFRKLGVSVRKPLPRTLLEEADADADAVDDDDDSGDAAGDEAESPEVAPREALAGRE